jgi:hypothetical protein
VAPFPLGCQINTDIDNTNDISNVDQPPLLMMHGTADTIIPYTNGKKVFMRAQAVGLESALITMQGAGHVPWNVIFNQSTFFRKKRRSKKGRRRMKLQTQHGAPDRTYGTQGEST